MTDKPNPFVIKVQPGTTEVDLGPILRPIIFWVQRKSGNQADPDRVDNLMADLVDELDYQRRLQMTSTTLLLSPPLDCPGVEELWSINN